MECGIPLQLLHRVFAPLEDLFLFLVVIPLHALQNSHLLLDLELVVLLLIDIQKAVIAHPVLALGNVSLKRVHSLLLYFDEFVLLLAVLLLLVIHHFELALQVSVLVHQLCVGLQYLLRFPLALLRPIH